jgi:hypothetical protein
MEEQPEQRPSRPEKRVDMVGAGQAGNTRIHPRLHGIRGVRQGGAHAIPRATPDMPEG